MVTIRWLREQIRQGKTIYDLPLRVTFYARVSTEKVEQQGSLENQIQYYTEFIQKNPNWTYVPGYIDEGISGTSTYKRDSFLRMIVMVLATVGVIGESGRGKHVYIALFAAAGVLHLAAWALSMMYF